VHLLIAIALCCLIAPLAGAQELPIRTWNVRDGLIQSRVNSIVRDSDGYMWFATWEGASRFDGQRFLNYGSREGLPNPLVWCVAEAPDGEIWLGTHGGGIARIARTGRAVLAEPIGALNPAPCVYEIAFDREARMWLVTDQGLFVSEAAPPAQLHFEPLSELGSHWFGRPFLDERAQLWFIAEDEVVRCRGRVLERSPLPDEGQGELRALARRGAGGCWAMHVRSLHALELPAQASGTPLRRAQPIDFGPGTSLYDVCEDQADRLWVATSRGLLRLEGQQQRWFTTAQGLPDDWVHSLAQERQGGMWIGTHQGGAAFLPDSGVEHYTRRSGLGDGHAVKLVALDAERWLVPTEVAGVFELSPGGARQLPGSDRPPFDRIQHNLARDQRGEWWIGTSSGLFHAPGPELDLSRARRYGEDDAALASASSVLGLDRSGRVIVAGEQGSLFVGDGAGAGLRRLPIAPQGQAFRCVALHPDGTTWLGDHQRLWRWRGGELEAIEPLPERGAQLQPRVLCVDSRGWLWVGTRSSGLCFTRDPAAERPSFEHLGSGEGLASDVLFALAESREGAMILGTGRGIQRYRPEARVLETLGEDDALAGEWITDLAFDARGDLWVASANGVSRMREGAAASAREPPRVRFTRCVVAGAELALPAAGSIEAAAIEVEAQDSRLAFEYVAVDPVHAHRLRYQTRLEGLDSDWSEPSRELSARYGQLAAGEYRFEVRCVDPSAGMLGRPSTLSIEVVPPLWTRPWFLLLALLSLAGLGFAAHRLRLRRELALERVRSQIAGDLHDDLGAGLVQIAISSELARGAPAGEASELMAEVAGLARDLRASMSDLVWAVDPRHDTLADIAGRMQHFASDLIAGAGQSVEFKAPSERELSRLLVAPDRRRNLFLLYKEAVANIARHARASRVRIELELHGRRLLLSIRDDGCGFDPLAQVQGEGLPSLRRRARELGALLRIDSAPGRGSHIVLDAPLMPHDHAVDRNGRAG